MSERASGLPLHGDDIAPGGDEYAGVVGATRLHEYVTIDRASVTMHLLVASDD